MFSLNLWDPWNPNDVVNLAIRPLTYPSYDIVIVCFSVIKPASFKRVDEYWVPEMKKYCRPN